MVPFGLSENTLGPAFVNFAENPHVVAVGRAQSGRTNFLRVMMRSIMARYSPDEATIVLIDPRRKLVGVVPDEWLSRYSLCRRRHQDGGRTACAQLLEQRQPPPGTSQQDMLTRQVLDGQKDIRRRRRHHVVADRRTTR